MARMKVNEIGLERTDYKGNPSTLCQGCGHDSIAAGIIMAAFEMSLPPHEIIKMSGIGCSSKSPAYFFNRSHGFNSVHGRMPSVTTGGTIANRTLRPIAVSGDGDSGSIGLGQFKHVIRRNVRMVYIVENNGVYGLTKGQFSATADKGQTLKYAGRNEFMPLDLCMEAIIADCGFVARSFAGDAKQVRALIKAAISFNGTAVLDIISPCVTFNNHPESTKSYPFGKENEQPIHDIHFVPQHEEITVDYEPGSTVDVQMHDGSHLLLQKLDQDYDPTDRAAAMALLEESRRSRTLTTGLIYFNEERATLNELLDLPETPLSALPESALVPSRSRFDEMLATFL
ncbi:MAG: 2-oxoacid:ferredoxin oxidoreductase subunit beta [Anaerolineales bacterium]|nr:2-oxoacid:ferredoxin oxidoreductase subunit beta [Anaerolineales bacterium]MCB9128875.1 2-oxoacid:ferredoxin oxidoreductase subunit beta [Ardenticatenales bacterium]MCB9172857.1 2-oxoacid:ferredoxin oxidoreductase subunit beta [Ardenticatenales bacterium]